MTNYEEPVAKDTTINYQMLQQLYMMTDEEIDIFTAPTYRKICNIATSPDAMLRTLRADPDSTNSYNRALSIYPELMREAYSRESLRNTKRRMTWDARSGAIYCANKRVFVSPDWYAACQHWFSHIENPDGLLPNGYIACKQFIKYNEVDVLRSPSLYFEHVIEKVAHDDEVYRWFTTNAIVTSCHDLISKILQFD